MARKNARIDGRPADVTEVGFSEPRHQYGFTNAMQWGITKTIMPRDVYVVIKRPSKRLLRLMILHQYATVKINSPTVKSPPMALSGLKLSFRGFSKRIEGFQDNHSATHIRVDYELDPQTPPVMTMEA